MSKTFDKVVGRLIHICSDS